MKRRKNNFLRASMYATLITLIPVTSVHPAKRGQDILKAMIYLSEKEWRLYTRQKGDSIRACFEGEDIPPDIPPDVRKKLWPAYQALVVPFVEKRTLLDIDGNGKVGPGANKEEDRTVTPSLDERIDELHAMVPKNSEERGELASLLESRIEIAEKSGDYESVVKDKFNLANVIYESGTRTQSYNKAVDAYTAVIEFAREKNVGKSYVDDCFSKIGDMYMEGGKESSSIKKGIFAYLDGILEGGDMQRRIMESIGRLYNARNKKEINKAISKYVKENPGSRKELYNHFLLYKREYETGQKMNEILDILSNDKKEQRHSLNPVIYLAKEYAIRAKALNRA